jgi:ketosteroid isomerase-like protein
MSEQEVATLRSLYAAFSGLAAGGDVEEYVKAYYDRDCTYHPVEEDGVVRGHDDLVRWNARWFDAWDEFGVDVEELTAVRDGVFVVGLTARGRGAESRMDVGQTLFHVCEMRGGRVLCIREYLDRDEAFQAARQR